MDSRERVLRAIHGEAVDRVPSNFRAEVVTQNKLKRFTGMSVDEFCDAYDVDIRAIDGIPPAEKHMGDFYQNFWGERYVYYDTEFGKVREDLDGALFEAEEIEDIEAFPWPDNDGMDYAHIPALCDRYAGRAILYGSGDIWQRPGLVRGMENFMIDMVVNPEFCHYMSRKYTDFYIEDYRRAQEVAGGRIDIFQVFSDLGTQRAPLISNAMLDEYVVPYLKEIADAVHEMNAHLFFHTCGMVEPFIDQLKAAGVDILDPLQPCCDQMQPEYLHAKHGGKLAFHGGIDVQGVLVNGSPDDVRKTVARYRDAFGLQGGYICCPSHLFQIDTPIENMQALYEEIIRPKY